MGGMYRISTTLKVNDIHKTKNGRMYDNINITFCHNWSGDDWFIRLNFENHKYKWFSNRIGDYNKYVVFEKFIKKCVNKFIIKEFECNITKIKEMIKEHFGENAKFIRTNI